MDIESFAASLLGLIMSLGALAAPSFSQVAQTSLPTETKDYLCEAARRDAASGIFHGTRIGTQKTGLADACIAAVYDPSRVRGLEANPIKNPKNFRCVGKNVRLTFAADDSGMLTESWSAAEKVSAGTCATQFCDEGGCMPAKLLPVLPSVAETSGSVTGADTYLDSEIYEDFAASPSAQPIATHIAGGEGNLGERIDDAFTQIDAARFERDSSGIPDVSKTKNPELFTGMRNLGNELALFEYENRVTPSEVQNNFEYQNLSFASQGVDLTSAIPTSQQVPIGIFNEISQQSPEIGAQSFMTGESTFDSKRSFWSNWRRSDNIEDYRPTWTELVQSRAGEAYGAVQRWVVGAGVATKNTVQGLFR